MKIQIASSILTAISLVFIGISFCLIPIHAVDRGCPDNMIQVDLPAADTQWDDSICIPKGRKIYALLVSGYDRNVTLDELHFYNLATVVKELGGYIHWAWWNNLLAPYMERPLHLTPDQRENWSEEDSSPGQLAGAESLEGFLQDLIHIEGQGNKAIPAEDYQFQADAEAWIKAIRSDSDSRQSIILVAGHSMGGGSILRLAASTDQFIDILAPIDPVGNRGKPFGRLLDLSDAIDFGSLKKTLNEKLDQTFNWTRWRALNEFDGYRARCRKCPCEFSMDSKIECSDAGFGDWVDRRSDIDWGQPAGNIVVEQNEGLQTFDCCTTRNVFHTPFSIIDPGIRLTFGVNIRHIHHRWQTEFLFPFDYQNEYRLGESGDPRFDESRVETQHHKSEEVSVDRSRGDGHGEIVGYRWNGFEGEFCVDFKGSYFITPKFAFPLVCPLGVQAVNLPGDHPFDQATNHSETRKERVKALMAWMETSSTEVSRYSGKEAEYIVDRIIDSDNWEKKPEYPELCLVSRELAVKLVKLWQLSNR